MLNISGYRAVYKTLNCVWFSLGYSVEGNGWRSCQGFEACESQLKKLWGFSNFLKMPALIKNPIWMEKLLDFTNDLRKKGQVEIKKTCKVMS